MRITNRTLGLVLAGVLFAAAPAAAQAPHRLEAVRALAGSGAGALLMQGCKTSKEACGQFTRLVACHLAPEGFGLLTKQPGENQVDGFAVDALIFKATSQVVDIIASNESPNATPGWSEVPRRSGNNWAAPVGCAAPVPLPDPQKPPDPNPVDGAASAELQQQQLALLLQIVAKLEAQIDGQKGQSAALEAAIRDLKAEIAKGLKVRF